MSVRIPIDGDPSGAIRAVDALRTALRAAAGDGKALADIDLRNLGAGDLARDLERSAQNLRDLVKMGRGQTATDARRIFGAQPGLDDLFNIHETASVHFPDPNDRARFTRNVSSYAMRGTSYDPASAPQPAPVPAPSPPPPAPPPPKPFSFGQEEQGGIMKAVTGGLAGGAGFFLAQMGLSSIAGVAGAAMHAGTAGNDATDQLLRRTGDLANSFDLLRKGADEYHQGLLTNIIDFTRYSAAFAAASGQGAGAAMRGTRLAMGVAEGYGSDAGSYVQSMARATVLGLAPPEFAALIGDAVSRGGMGGRADEAMQAILHWTQSASRVSGSSSALMENLSGFNDLYSAMQASKNPMFAGGNGEALLGQINSSLMGGGGGGLAGQALVARALMRAGIKNPYEQELQEKKGAFALVGNTGKTYYDLAMAEAEREYGGLDQDGTRAGLAVGTLLGINPNTAIALRRLHPTGSSIARVNTLLQGYGGLDKIAPSGLPDIFRAANADPATLNAMKTALLHNDSGFMDGQKISNAESLNLANSTKPEDIRDNIIKILATHGMVQTDATRAQDAENRRTDDLVSIGGALVNVMTPLSHTLTDMLDPVKTIADAMRKSLRPGTTDILEATTAENVLQNGKLPSSAIPMGAAGGLLARIRKQESQNGKTSDRLYGELPSTFLWDAREAAKTDPFVADAIKGKSDAEIMAMETRENSALQDHTASWHLQHYLLPMMADRGVRMTDSNAYALWHFDKAGIKIANSARDSDTMESVVGPQAYAANPYLKGMTVGDWKARFGKMFPQESFGGAASPFDHAVPTGASGAAGATQTVNVKGSLTVKHVDKAGNVTQTQSVPLTQAPSGQPMPHGTQ